MASSNFLTLNINTGYSGVHIFTPSNPILPDNTINIVLVIRGGKDAQWASQTQLNAIIVTAEAGGMGSLENSQTYGKSDFPNAIVTKIIEAISKQTGKQVKLGKFGLVSFSGGYDAVNKILSQRGQLFYTIRDQKIKYDIDSLIMMDGMHHNITPNGTGNIAPEMDPYIKYAQESIKDPNKKFIIMHSAIKPSYASTTETSDYILKKLKLDRKPITQGQLSFTQGNQTITPKSIAGAGGFQVVQMFDKSDKTNPAVQHMFIGSLIPQVLKNNIANQWNQKTTISPDKSSIPIKNKDLIQKIDEFLHQVG